MTITQTVEIPASHRLTIDVPPEVPEGPVVLVFKPVEEEARECPICAAHRDPVTGEELFNARIAASIEEARAMMRGEIPSTEKNAS